jgi:hypothetical protein
MRAKNGANRRLSGEDGSEDVRREQGQHDLHPDTNGEAQAKGLGEIDWDERFSLLGSDRSGGSGDQEQFSQSEDSGGIRGQLREFFGLFLEYVHAHRERLEKRLDENVTFEEKLTHVYEQLDSRLSQLADNDNSSEQNK